MKKVFKTLVVVFTAVLLVSCGAGSKDIVGKWALDINSLDLQLGDAVPADIKEVIESQKGDAMEEASENTELLIIEFTNEGKVGLPSLNAPYSYNYTIEGDKLNIKGEVEGKKVEASITLAEATADKFTVSITGDELWAQVKKQAPEMINEVPEEMDVDAMMKGSSIAISFKKG